MGQTPNVALVTYIEQKVADQGAPTIRDDDVDDWDLKKVVGTNKI